MSVDNLFATIQGSSTNSLKKQKIKKYEEKETEDKLKVVLRSVKNNQYNCYANYSVHSLKISSLEKFRKKKHKKQHVNKMKAF